MKPKTRPAAPAITGFWLDLRLEDHPALNDAKFGPDGAYCGHWVPERSQIPLPQQCRPREARLLATCGGVRR